jgi:hypothetical protein
MNDPKDAAERLGHQLDRAAALRAATRDKPKLETARQRVRAWQSVRLARTHADLLASSRMGLAATFFLTDLYNAENLVKVGANVRRIVPTITKLLPATALETIVDAIELEALSEELDLAMATALAAKSGEISAATYADAYRKVDRRSDRERQIQLIEDLGNSLDRLVHLPLVGTTLSLMHAPAQIAGLGDLQDFLQRGYKAFASMGGAGEFLRRIVDRERRLLEALFAGDDSRLGM